ncbi:MAG: tetratricopeptide repeat protein, partial [Syntrophothermus sp.]
EVEASKALETALTKAREAAKTHRLAGDRVVYKVIDEIGLNMEKAEKLASAKKAGEAEDIVRSTIEKGVHNGLLDENTINMMGYDYLGKENYPMALLVFRLNTVLYPKSANVFDSMGEAYMKSGDKANAILNYRKSLDMNPKNTNAAETLKKLGAM